MRPLRPSQSIRRVDGDDNYTGQVPKMGSRLGPIARTRRATCSQCRIRKVRCDGREGLCQNCDRLGFECSFQQSPSKSPGRYLKSPERRRRMQACIAWSVRWSLSFPLSTYLGSMSRLGVATPTTASDGDRSSTTPGRETPVVGCGSPPPSASTTEKVSGTSSPDSVIVAEHIEDYFDHLYPLPFFAFLHKPTIVQRHRDGTVNEPLKFAICAITSLHLQHAPLCHPLWAQEAERLILEKIGQPSIFHLQALLLVIRYRIESGEFPTAFVTVALRLNYERIELAFVAQEARRRLFWALYLLDDYFCVGLREFELCPEETIHLQLPCQERIFEAGQQCQTGMLRPSTSDDSVAMGLRGAFVRLISARRAIMRFNRRVGLGEESSLSIGTRIQQFERELACLRTALSPEHQYSISNLALCEWPAQFVMLHMSYYQCHCDLYRMFLTGYSEAAPSGLLANMRPQDCIAMQAACLEHAENIIRILDDFVTSHSNGHRQLLLLERDAAVCAFESARLVMFGARLVCATSTLEVAIHKAREVSLQFITKFFSYSASTRPLSTALEHLISSYSKRLAGQTQPRAQEVFSEPEAAAPRSSSKISRFASSRQRLSVQSLLLQSDFTDDSHEIAGPFPAPSATASEAETAYPSYLQANVSPLPNLVTIREDKGTSDPSPPILSSSPSSGMSVSRSTTIGTPLTFPPSNYSSAMNQQSSQPYPQLRPPAQQQSSRPASSSPWVMTIDARREDAGLIFNPWMGFTGTEELYGLSDGLGEEY
ncbi:hypothetical protein GGR58DRAFT_514855 [Xylaria digitata]|nr:hypothetical protein GGR58DRAFT_514855 [Xylaria digitata]